MSHNNRQSKRARRRRRQEKERLKREEESRKNLRPWWRHISRVWAGLAALALVLGLITSYLALVPKVTVELGQQILPYDPLSVPFIVTNENPFPLYGVTARCSLENMVGVTVPIHMEDGSQMRVPVTNAGTEYTPSVNMISGDKLPVSCSGPNRDPEGYDVSQISNGEVILTVKFRPFWIFWEQKKQFHFGTIPTASGKLSLVPMPARDALSELE